ncbi:hypothetical protein ASG44_05540 [Methylophilus sp. Leaf459]|nr:hypothetical protein ASG34_05565 [Methylophilus sp. Leaf416]KQT56409.1 hypothetical protein ASG44_05540 [Methylophilus sp. Leaf459]
MPYNLLTLILALMLNGCVTRSDPYLKSSSKGGEHLAQEARQRDQRPNEQKYQLGSREGCNAGRNASGAWGTSFTKNDDLYVNNQNYKTGWDDGFAKCKAEGDNLNNIIRDSVR